MKKQHNEIKYNTGDSVRSTVTGNVFENDTESKWSKTIHKIIEVGNHPYKLNNNNWYKYCQLQKANNVSNLNIMKTRNKSKELIKEQMNYI